MGQLGGPCTAPPLGRADTGTLPVVPCHAVPPMGRAMGRADDTRAVWKSIIERQEINSNILE